MADGAKISVLLTALEAEALCAAMDALLEDYGREDELLTGLLRPLKAKLRHTFDRISKLEARRKGAEP